MINLLLAILKTNKVNTNFSNGGQNHGDEYRRLSKKGFARHPGKG